MPVPVFMLLSFCRRWLRRLAWFGLPGLILCLQAPALAQDAWYFARESQGTVPLKAGEALCFLNIYARTEVSNAVPISEYDRLHCHEIKDPALGAITWRQQSSMQLANPILMSHVQAEGQRAQEERTFLIILATAFAILIGLGAILYVSSRKMEYLLYTMGAFILFTNNLPLLVPIRYLETIVGRHDAWLTLWPLLTHILPALGAIILTELLARLLVIHRTYFYRCIQVLFGLAILHMVFATSVFSFASSDSSLRLVVQLVRLFSTVVLVFANVVILHELIRNRKKVALYLLPSYLALMAGALVFVQTINIVPQPAWGTMAYAFGSFCQGLLFYLALGRRIKEQDDEQKHALHEWAQHLDEKVQARTAEISALFESSPSAIALFDQSGHMVSGNHSATDLFAGQDTLESVLKLLAIEGAKTEALKSVLGETDIAWLVNEPNFPSESHVSGKTFFLRWGPVYRDSLIAGVTLTASDITEAMRAQDEAAKAQAEARTLQALVHISPQQRQRLMKDMRKFCDSLDASRSSEAKRAAHTLKGNALSLGFTTLGEAIHLWESNLMNEDSILSTVRDVETLYSKVFGSGEGKIISKDRALQAIFGRKTEEFLVEEFFPTLESIVRQSPSYAAAQRLAGKLEKKPPNFEIHGGSEKFSPTEATALETVFIHAIRNSIDHGFEPAAERSQIGKPQAGTIFITAVRNDDEVRVRIMDDGRGLDLTSLRRKTGNTVGSDDQIALSIFQSGISTKDVVTDVSGRGVGLDAAKDAIEGLAGSVSVQLHETLAPGFRRFSIVLSFPRRAEVSSLAS